MAPQRHRLRVTGVVQGVGFRPFVHQLAGELHLVGFVGNDPHGVFVEAEGQPWALVELARRLRADVRPPAVVESVVVVDVVPVQGDSRFLIVDSRGDDSVESPVVALVPPDTATCRDCLAETLDPSDRRYRYPFTACTHCGPRYTMVRGMPYDRPFTTMAGFPLCHLCRAEYDDPANRRFHAQPTACPACGPSLWFRSRRHPDDEVRRDLALAAALAALRSGEVVAVKGLGGYHLACDATRPEAVRRLRSRKQRSEKPFAVLVPDIESARRLAVVDDSARSRLTSPVAPIVVLPVCDEDGAQLLAGSVAPGVGSIGLMLAYTPLHHLLFQAHPQAPDAWQPSALVFTSGNLNDEPICTDPGEAEERLQGIADAFLHHDRPIHVACDDSVERVDGHGAVQPLRRSRGHAPLPVSLPFDTEALLAVGGELKATVCLAHGSRGWLSQHLGDVASLATLESLERAVTVLSSLVRVTPEALVADLHPSYLSARWARERSRDAGVGCLLVQHHHAHLASLLAEHQLEPGRPVLGFTFDGTGFGTDGTVWGGEVLLGSYAHVDRVGHLAPVQLPGGDAAVQRPARMALSHLHSARVSWDLALPGLAAVDPVERRVLAGMLRSGSACLPTTSMGRLFDAVAVLAGVGGQVTYEGQAAIELEALSQAAQKNGQGSGSYGFEVGADLVLDPAPVVAQCVEDVLAGVPVGVVGLRFHRAVAAAILQASERVRRHEGVRTVGLTGGVFQNLLLVRLTREMLEEHDFEVLTHRVVPPNDGGLALGQVAVAASGGAKEAG